MPFYAKDWRSPGESWIKTEDGWEKLKVLETNRRRRLISEDGVFNRFVCLHIVIPGIEIHKINETSLFKKIFYCCYDRFDWCMFYLSNDTKRRQGQS